jgi:hypothetical protein
LRVEVRANNIESPGYASLDVTDPTLYCAEAIGVTGIIFSENKSWIGILPACHFDIGCDRSEGRNT